MTAGRPREFDVDAALLQAVRVFWSRGYDGTSLTDLTDAMGINRPSLYAAFGNKNELYRKAIARYGARDPGMPCLAEPTASAVVEGWLLMSVDNATDPATPPGCFLVHATMTCADAPPEARAEILAQRRANERVLRERLERAAAEGDLPPDVDPAALARFVETVSQGIAVHSAAGATREDLLAVVAMTMRTLPA